MEDRQIPRQGSGDDSPALPLSGDKAELTRELGEKMTIDMKPPTSTVGLLAKSTALLPSGIIRVKQLQNAAPKELSPSKTSGSATGNPRNKTALAPGHSLMDWIRLGSSGVDLTGVGGRLVTVTPAELARHNKEDDAWIAIRGIVFNVSHYMSFHPGGVPELMKAVGKDATKLFDDVHAWVNYQSILQKCVVGRLERSVSAELKLESDKNKAKKSPSSKTVPNVPTVRVDWRQTSNNLTLYFNTPSDDHAGECCIKNLSEADSVTEFSLEIWLEKSGNLVTHKIKLFEAVEWPPICQWSCETREIELIFKKKNRSIWQKYGSCIPSYEKVDSRKQIFNEYEVLENTPLCKVVHLLVLRAQNYIQLVPPGRHVEAKMDVMGTLVSRAYTPVPSSLHPDERPSSYTEDCLCLMVKRYEDGALSPILTSMQPGERLLLSNSQGSFRAEAYDDYSTLHLLAAGTGLTVMLPVIKRALSRRNAPTVNLINFNKNGDSIFYDQQLDRLSRERPFKVTHVLSEATSTWSGRIGIVSEELLNELISEPSSKACIFICGPAGFMKVAKESLQKLNWQLSQMYVFAG